MSDSGKLECHDCGLPYDDPGWLDACIPEADWHAISPTGGHGGLLCITCIAERLVVAGRKDIPLLVGSGPFRHDPNYWRDVGFEAGRERQKEEQL